MLLLWLRWLLGVRRAEEAALLLRLLLVCACAEETSACVGRLVTLEKDAAGWLLVLASAGED